MGVRRGAASRHSCRRTDASARNRQIARTPPLSTDRKLSRSRRHLFNRTLIHAGLLRRIGLPDARFFIRGDEVKFLYRARRAGTGIVLDIGAEFLHPGSRTEIHPILGGRFYAVVPEGPVKQFHQFRNRG